MKITKSFFDDIRRLIVAARCTVSRGVDLVQVHTNFEIGRRIVEQEQHGKDRAAYGKEILKQLAERLSKEFGRGYSPSNLANIRGFFLAYQDRSKIFQSSIGKSSSNETVQKHGNSKQKGQKAPSPIFQSSIGKSQIPPGRPESPFTLSWTHYILLLGIKNSEERNFYEIEAHSQHWTVQELRRQYNSSLYERLALSRNKTSIRQLAKKGQIVAKPQDILKEPLVLEFLGLAEKAGYSESDLETAIISQIEHFLLEMGKGFLFEARQKRFTFDDDHFFVDLVFYNRLLRCYVLIDLKIGKLTHQDLGQMQMYVNYYDRQVKTAEETPTVGIILCKKKHETLVKITLPKDTNIHAQEYQLYLPTKAELQKKLAQWAAEAGDV